MNQTLINNKVNKLNNYFKVMSKLNKLIKNSRII